MTNQKITSQVSNELSMLEPHLGQWAKEHLVTPKLVSLYSDFDNDTTEDYWLVTDHNGTNDSCYRVVYSDKDDMFGIEMELNTGRNVMMGLYGSFAETVESIP